MSTVAAETPEHPRPAAQEPTAADTPPTPTPPAASNRPRPTEGSLQLEYEQAGEFARHTETIAWAVGAIFVPAALAPFLALPSAVPASAAFADRALPSALSVASLVLYSAWFFIHERMREVNEERHKRIRAIERTLHLRHHRHVSRRRVQFPSLHIRYVWRALGAALVLVWAGGLTGRALAGEWACGPVVPFVAAVVLLLGSCLAARQKQERARSSTEQRGHR